MKQSFQEMVRAIGLAPTHVGICCPGLPSADQLSIIAMPQRLRGLEGFVWDKFLSFPRPIPVLNDAKAALLAEHWRGAAQGMQNIVLLTLGTGVGGAALVDGRLLHGHGGRAGHLGHVSLDPEGRPDVVGTPGSLEDAIGQCTLSARCGGRFATTRELVAAAEADDAEARRVWHRSLKALAAALASFINILDPEIIVLTGGIADAGDSLLRPLEGYLRAMEWRIGGLAVPLRTARLGSQAGALGAAHYAMHLYPATL